MRPQTTVPVRRIIGCAMLSVSLAGCNRWQVQAVSPAALIAQQHPHSVRLTRSDRSAVVLRGPEVQGDTVFGTAGADPRAAGGMALADITSVATRKLDPVATGGLVLGSAAVVAGTVLAILVASFPQD